MVSQWPSSLLAVAWLLSKSFAFVAMRHIFYGFPLHSWSIIALLECFVCQCSCTYVVMQTPLWIFSRTIFTSSLPMQIKKGKELENNFLYKLLSIRMYAKDLLCICWGGMPSRMIPSATKAMLGWDDPFQINCHYRRSLRGYWRFSHYFKH